MATGSTQPFKPACTVSIAVTETSADVAIPGTGQSVLCVNGTTSNVFVAFGNGSATASPTGCFPIPPGGSRLLGISAYVDTAAAILPTGSEAAGNVYFSRGDGTIY
jgi:hypothetical protein